MAIDAIAVLPLLAELSTAREPTDGEEDWSILTGPAGIARAASTLRDAILVNLAMPIGTDDAELHHACQQWAGTVPARVWVFPDTAVPPAETAKAVRSATSSVGRWVKAGTRKRSLLEDFGFTPQEADAWQRDINSADQQRFDAAMAKMEEHLAGRDPAEIKALIAASLKR